MSYERLTKRDEYGHWYTNSTVYDRGMTSEDGVHYEKHYFENGLSAYDGEPIDRLAELEDKIEAGTMVELPCKVGDKVCKFIVKENKQFFITEAVCIKIEISRKGVLYMFSTLTSRYLHENFFGKLSDDFIDVEQYYICTKEAAEARLKELREKE